MARHDDFDEEDALFLAVMEGRDLGPPPEDPLPLPSPQRSAHSSTVQEQEVAYEQAFAEEQKDPFDEEAELFYSAMEHLDPEQIPHAKDRHEKQPKQIGLQRLKASKKPIEEFDEELDLHGFTVEQAMHRLSRFIASARKRGKRRVLVVTGKGHRSKDGIGKIRKATEQWIQQRGKRAVESYAPAPRAQGGSGAFVLILRRD